MSRQEEPQRLDGNRGPDSGAQRLDGRDRAVVHTVLSVATCVVTAEAKEGSDLVSAESVTRLVLVVVCSDCLL